MDDATQTRIDKIYSIIEQSRFSIHDLSRTELDLENQLPRFNMPLELGIFLAAKRFGGDGHSRKRALIFDIEQFRFQKFISDLSGMDVNPHGGDPRQMVARARDWLATVSQRSTIPPTTPLLASYDRFTAGLPAIAGEYGLDEQSLAYPDFERLALAWVKAEREDGRLS